MKQQEAFNKVWQHFVVEKNPPGRSGDGIGCFYCTPEGNRCAVGALVTMEEAKKMVADELGSVRHMQEFNWRIYIPESIRNLDRQFLIALQDSHDNTTRTTFHSSFEAGLRELAVNFSLEVPA